MDRQNRRDCLTPFCASEGRVIMKNDYPHIICYLQQLCFSESSSSWRGSCNYVYWQRKRQNSNMADLLLCLVTKITIFSSKILIWLIKAAMLEFCYLHTCIYILPCRFRWLNELLVSHFMVIHNIIINMHHAYHNSTVFRSDRLSWPIANHLRISRGF